MDIESAIWDCEEADFLQKNCKYRSERVALNRLDKRLLAWKDHLYRISKKNDYLSPHHTQKKSDEKRQFIGAYLQSRGLPGDEEAARLMRSNRRPWPLVALNCHVVNIPINSYFSF